MDAEDDAVSVVGSASVPLRPLRFLFDVEANAAVVPTAHATSQPLAGLFKSVHVRVRLSVRAPPLHERQDESGGFLRSEVPEQLDWKLSSSTDDEEGGEDGATELAALRGRFVWMLVRVQPRQQAGEPPASLLRVQYQPFASCESFCLPVDHTNILRVLVTDDVVRHVDLQSLHLRFLPPSVGHRRIESPAPAVATSAAPSSPVKEVAVYDEDREAKAVARAVALVERGEQQRAQQLAALKDAERKSEAAAERAAFASERARLEQELAASTAKREALEHAERRRQEQDESKADAAKREHSQRQAAATTDDALEAWRPLETSRSPRAFV